MKNLVVLSLSLFIVLLSSCSYEQKNVVEYKKFIIPIDISKDELQNMTYNQLDSINEKLSISYGQANGYNFIRYGDRIDYIHRLQIKKLEYICDTTKNIVDKSFLITRIVNSKNAFKIK